MNKTSTVPTHIQSTSSLIMMVSKFKPVNYELYHALLQGFLIHIHLFSPNLVTTLYRFKFQNVLY